MFESKRILIVDDEHAIREMVCLALRQHGFHCLEAANAHEAEQKIQSDAPDLLLLDWMLPGLSGVDFVRKLRRQDHTRHLPVIMVTAKTEEHDRVLGLDSGADDYLTKPFSTKEMMARIRAMLRRVAPDSAPDALSISGLTLDPISHRVMADGHNIRLGPTEFRLLKFFMENTERVYSREQVLNNVWGENTYVEERTVDVHIRRLRKALTPTQHHRLIQTIRGTGYRFSARI